MCNNLSHSHALREVLVPDESSIAILDKSSPEQKAARDMSMCAGEFMIAYGESKEEVCVMGLLIYIYISIFACLVDVIFTRFLILHTIHLSFLLSINK
jgi:hypothetical protein